MFLIPPGSPSVGNNVTINEAKVKAIGDEISVTASSSINTTTSMQIDQVENRCELKNIDLCITTTGLNGSATVSVTNA